MQDQERNIQQDNKEKPMPYLVKCVVIGFWGGLLSSFAGYLAYLLNFTAFGPGLVLSPLTTADWQSDTLGQIVGIFVIALLSIPAAIVYKVLLEKWYSMWVGVGYGAAIWLIVFLLFHPIFPKLKPIADFDVNTLVTTITFYLLYGLFIGYSICFEYNELNQPQGKKSSQSSGGQTSGSES